MEETDSPTAARVAWQSGDLLIHARFLLSFHKVRVASWFGSLTSPVPSSSILHGVC